MELDAATIVTITAAIIVTTVTVFPDRGDRYFSKKIFTEKD
jgi:hypothetical protein